MQSCWIGQCSNVCVTLVFFPNTYRCLLKSGSWVCHRPRLVCHQRPQRLWNWVSGLLSPVSHPVGLTLIHFSGGPMRGCPGFEFEWPALNPVLGGGTFERWLNLIEYYFSSLQKGLIIPSRCGYWVWMNVPVASHDIMHTPAEYFYSLSILYLES